MPNKSPVLTNWRTTAIGAAAGVVGVLDTAMHTLATGEPVQWGQVAVSALIAVGLAFSKDAHA